MFEPASLDDAVDRRSAVLPDSRSCSRFDATGRDRLLVCLVVALVEIGVALGELGEHVVGGVVVSEVAVDRGAGAGSGVRQGQGAAAMPGVVLEPLRTISSTSADPLRSYS